MHEFGIMQNIYAQVEKAATDNRLRKVTRVRLQIGKLRQVVPDFLKFAWDAIANGTIAEGAELVIVEVPVTVKCKACNREFEVTESVYLCPNCGNADITILTGKEIVLESIDGENCL